MLLREERLIFTLPDNRKTKDTTKEFPGLGIKSSNMKMYNSLYRPNWERLSHCISKRNFIWSLISHIISRIIRVYTIYGKINLSTLD